MIQRRHAVLTALALAAFDQFLRRRLGASLADQNR